MSPWRMRCKRFAQRWWRGMVPAAVILGLLAYALWLAVRAPVGEQATAVATIATGLALVAVACLTYLLERRSFEVTHEPSLGIIWKEPGMYPRTEIIDDEEREVYAEFVVWNAGNVPVLLWQPARVVFDSRLRGTGLGRGRVEIERVREDRAVVEKAFPIVLAVGETCVWRQFTGDVGRGLPIVAHAITEDRDQAIRFLTGGGKGANRHFLYEVLYTARPPSAVSRRDLRKQYVAFYYSIEDHETLPGSLSPDHRPREDLAPAPDHRHRPPDRRTRLRPLRPH